MSNDQKTILLMTPIFGCPILFSCGLDFFYDEDIAGNFTRIGIYLLTYLLVSVFVIIGSKIPKKNDGKTARVPMNKGSLWTYAVFNVLMIMACPMAIYWGWTGVESIFPAAVILCYAGLGIFNLVLVKRELEFVKEYKTDGKIYPEQA